MSNEPSKIVYRRDYVRPGELTAEVLLQHVRIGVKSHLRARVPGKLLHRLHRGDSTKHIASGKAYLATFSGSSWPP